MLDERKTAILKAVVEEYIATAQPVGSTALAWWVLDEAIGVEQGIGALAVGVGVVLCARAAGRG